MVEKNKIYNEDCLKTMQRMPDEFVDLVVTSPPYDTIRKYKFEDVEEAWNFDKFKQIANELFRVMKDGGVIVWVVSDQTIDGSETGTSFRQALYFKDIGFKLFDTMIYEKDGNSLGYKNRYFQTFEYMFVISKGMPKTANLIRDRKNKMGGQIQWGTPTVRMPDGSLIKKTAKPVAEYSKRTNVWKILCGYNKTTSDKFAYKHPAMFPEQLAHDHIISWSNPKDLVYDPFIGSGTTAKMAKKLNRDYIGSEISKEYYEIALKRVAIIQRGII